MADEKRDPQNASAPENAPDKPRPYYPKSVNDALREENAGARKPSRYAPSPADAGTGRRQVFDFDRGSDSPEGAGRKAPARRAASRSRFSPLFFPAALLYHELLLRAFDAKNVRFFEPDLLRVVLFSLAAGLVVHLLLDLIPQKSVSRLIGALLLLLFTVFVCVERGVRFFFQMYYGLTTIASMGMEVAADFREETSSAIRGILPFILLSLAPLAAFLPLRRRVIPDRGASWGKRGVLLLLLVLLQLGGWGLSAFGASRPAYTYDFSFTNAIPRFGLLTAQRLELEYAVFGLPEEDLSGYIEDPGVLPGPDGDREPDGGQAPDDGSQAPDDGQTPGGDQGSDGGQTPGGDQDPPAPPRDYGPNVIDSIDFEALAGSTSDKTLKSMHEYFGSLTPSMENEYTGLFQGKNLIFITAESFSTAAMSEELTPTLWRLSHEGFVFTDFYQPDWTMSTAGGEFANMTGVIPNWVGGKMTIYAVLGNSMPMAMGSMFTKAGYNVNAYHDHHYTFYKRDQLFPELGYAHFNGAVEGTDGGMGWPEAERDDWPKSDLTMMELTADSYINEYLETGVPFHTYYMTVSAHSNWNWSNDMARKNRDAAQAALPDASPTVQAYVACNLELEAAMKYLVERLEAAGIADDTLIVLCTDHYPYRMLTEDADFYNELRGVEDTELDTSRFRTTLIMWSAAIEEPVTVDTPCYSCDILPTLLNLYGIEYDSRLYSGRDVFAQNFEPDEYSSCMPLVVFANNKGQGNSWITAAGTYEAGTGTFTPREGVTVSDDYVKKVKNLVAGKIKYAKLIVSEDYYSTLFK